MNVIDRTLDWIEGDPDPGTRAELRALIDAGDVEELEQRMAGTLRFGTAGIRGAVEAGSARMNRAVIIRTTAGLASYLRGRHGPDTVGPVVVGFDARLSSRQFADDTIDVLSAAGFEVRWFPEPTPTPIIAFAGKEMGAISTVIVTASHNPPQDNGYKVYDANAAQIVPPVDADIADAIDAVGPASSVERTRRGKVVEVGPELFERYWSAIEAERPKVHGGPIRVVTTPLHGVGGAPLVEVLARGGYTDVHPVPEQFEPDGHFPTVSFPNPEEPGALDLATALADSIEADLVIANDPDVDRLAVAVPTDDGWLQLTGNQIGVLLADHVLAHWGHEERPLVANSIVSSPMLRDVASLHGARFDQTLTGFKWICNAALDLEEAGEGRFAMGYEEALGYSIGPVVRDKDGISAALAFMDVAATAKAHGQTIADLLEILSARAGLWASAQHSLVRPGTEGIAEIASYMDRLSTDLPAEIDGHSVTSVVDYRTGEAQRPRWLPNNPLVVLELESGRVLVRPSGTEPKLKIYCDLRADLDAGQDFDAQLADLTSAAQRAADAMAEWLGA